MRCKHGIKVAGLRPEIVFALMIARDTYRDIAADLIVTSAIDGKHSRGSLHYSGSAVDLRTRHITKDQAQQMRDQIAARLTDEFDVILESDHIHLEFQPKG